MIGVLLCDRQHLVRRGVRMILEAEPDIHVVGECDDARHGLQLARQLDVDVVLVDVKAPDTDGFEAIARITALADPPKVVVLTASECDDGVFSALHAGASGFQVKDAPPGKLVDAIRAVAAGEALLTPSATRRIIDELTRRPSAVAASAVTGLTEREVDVLRLLAQGLTNQEIAEGLVVAEATVKSHVSSLLAKLGLRDRVQAVVYAYEHGLVQPGGASSHSDPERPRGMPTLDGSGERPS